MKKLEFKSVENGFPLAVTETQMKQNRNETGARDQFAQIKEFYVARHIT